MSPPLRYLPLLAAALLCPDASAQTEPVHLTTLRVQAVSAQAGAPALVSGRFASARPLVSGDVRVWPGTVSPVWARLAPAAPDAEPVAKHGDLPTELALRAAYPNPVATRATVPFDLPTAGPVRVGLYDVLGREVGVLVDESREAGRHTATLETGALAPGVYFVRLAAADAVLVSRLTVVR